MKTKRLYFYLFLLILIGMAVVTILIFRARRFDRILESRYGRPAIDGEVLEAD